MEREKLLKRLLSHIEYMEKENEDMDEVSWIYQEGIIISGNDAKLIVNVLSEFINLNNKEKIK